MSNVIAIDIELEDTLVFHPGDWIRQGKTYKDVPLYIARAFTNLSTIPDSAPNIPPPEMSIEGFLSLALPKQSYEIITSKTNQWFSCEPPQNNLPCSTSHSIPPESFLQKLNDASGQAWFDGAASVTDPRFNDGKDRLLLWVLTY